MSIGTDLSRIKSAKSAIITAINNKAGSTTATGKKLDALAPLITALPSGGLNTSDATAYASNIMSGYTAYARGAKVTGTISTYTGSYTVTPGTSAQTLATAGRYLSGNITINAASGGGQAMKSGSGSVTGSGTSVSVNVGFTPQMVTLIVQNSGTTYRFLVVYNAATGVVWQSNSTGTYHTLSTASVSGYTITFNFRTNANNAMSLTGTVTWQAVGYI